MLIATMLIATMLIATMLIATMLIATMLIATMLIATMLIATMLIATMLIARIPPHQKRSPFGCFRFKKWHAKKKSPLGGVGFPTAHVSGGVSFDEC